MKNACEFGKNCMKNLLAFSCHTGIGMLFNRKEFVLHEEEGRKYFGNLLIPDDLETFANLYGARTAAFCMIVDEEPTSAEAGCIGIFL